MLLVIGVVDDEMTLIGFLFDDWEDWKNWVLKNLKVEDYHCNI